MVSETEKIRRQLEKAKAEERESARKAQALGAKLTQAARKEDTRRKILAGSWALDRAEKSEEFRAEMYRDLGRAWLVRDDDRELFGLEPLTAAEKEQRTIPSGPRKKPGADETASDVPSSDAARQLAAEN